MNQNQHNIDVDALEAMIDRIGLPAVLDLLGEVCSAKADHIRENWQDSPLAESWDNDASKILGASFKVNRP